MRRILILGLCLMLAGCVDIAYEAGEDAGHRYLDDQESVKPLELKNTQQISRSLVETESKDCFFTGYAEFYPIDIDGDGIFNQLSASIEVQVVKGGSYTIGGQLQKGDINIAIAPFWQSAMHSRAFVEGEPGIYMVNIAFSGEEIFRSEIDGPYELSLYMIGFNGAGDSFVFHSPAYLHQEFGEQGAYVLSVEDEAVDTDSDGIYNFLKFKLSVLVRRPGRYGVELFIEGDSYEAGLSSRKTVKVKTKGIHTVEMFLPGHKISRAKLNGPYEGFVNLSHKESTIESTRFRSRLYRFLDFEPVLLNVQGNFKDIAIDEDGDGQYDILRISFDAESNVSGEYRVEVHLTSPFHMLEGSSVILQKGLQSLSFDFYGPDIRRIGQSGPYVFSQIKLIDIDTWTALDVAEAFYLTYPYDISDFSDRHPHVIESEDRLKRVNDPSTPAMPRVILEGEFLYVSPFYKGIFRADDGQEYMVHFRYLEKSGEERFEDLLNKYLGQEVRLTAWQDKDVKSGNYVAHLKDEEGKMIEGEIRIAEMIRSGQSILQLESYEMVSQ